MDESPKEITLFETTPTTGTDFVGDDDGVGLLVGVIVAEGVGVGDGVTDLLGVGEGEGDFETVGVGEGEGDFETVGVGDGVGDFEGVTEGVGVGFGSDALRVMVTGMEGPKFPEAACTIVIVVLPGLRTVRRFPEIDATCGSEIVALHNPVELVVG